MDEDADQSLTERVAAVVSPTMILPDLTVVASTAPPPPSPGIMNPGTSIISAGSSSVDAFGSLSEMSTKSPSTRVGGGTPRSPSIGRKSSAGGQKRGRKPKNWYIANNKLPGFSLRHNKKAEKGTLSDKVHHGKKNGASNSSGDKKRIVGGVVGGRRSRNKNMSPLMKVHNKGHRPPPPPAPGTPRSSCQVTVREPQRSL
jgi:hypothetical protein